MTDRFKNDRRLDPRLVPLLEGLDQTMSKFSDVDSREAALEVVNSPEELMKAEGMKMMMEAADDESVVPNAGLIIERKTIVSAPDGNSVDMNFIRPDTDETLPCVFYIHGGGMAFSSCFDGNYRAWGKMIAHQGLAVMMVDFRNCLSPSSAEEVAPFPAGLNDCVSGFLWTHDHASELNIDARHILIAGESGGGNLSIATTMQLLRDGHGDKQAGLYSMCPFINGRWPDPDLPSSSDNNGIFITVGSNLISMGYGIEQLEAKNPVAWPSFAAVEDVAEFPPTMVNVNECDPLRDEGIEFYRLLLSAGVKAHCRQVMGTMHAADLFVSAFPDLSRMTARDVRSWVDECKR